FHNNDHDYDHRYVTELNWQLEYWATQTLDFTSATSIRFVLKSTSRIGTCFRYGTKVQIAC
ncbi:unnamed protein product, partial [Heterosigma akashiwo]